MGVITQLSGKGTVESLLFGFVGPTQVCEALHIAISVLLEHIPGHAACMLAETLSWHTVVYVGMTPQKWRPH